MSPKPSSWLKTVFKKKGDGPSADTIFALSKSTAGPPRSLPQSVESVPQDSSLRVNRMSRDGSPPQPDADQGMRDGDNKVHSHTHSAGASQFVVASQITQSVEEREIALKKKDDLKATLLGAFKTMLTLASAAAQAEPIGIASALCDSISAVVDMAETTRDNRETLEQMTADMSELVRKLEGSVDPLATENPYKELIDKLILDIYKALDPLTHPQRGTFEKIAQRNAIAANLKECAQSIRDALLRFNTFGIINIGNSVKTVDASVNRIETVLLQQKDLDSLERLKPVKQAAHNSSRIGALPACLNGTREKVLEEITNWYRDGRKDSCPVFWLNGIAGTGKSTIAKTIAKKAQTDGLFGASFFLSRRAVDVRLRQATAVIPTIVYQLAGFSERYKLAVLKGLEKTPNVAELDLDSQANFLVEDLLPSLKGITSIPLVTLDAFDECDGSEAKTLLQQLLSKLLHGSGLPFKLLITSRPEIPIEKAFRTHVTSARLVLHNIEESVVQGDIELFLRTNLTKVPDDLDLTDYPPSWFEPHLADLVQRSGKLFVYAATAVRFVSEDPPAQPLSRLIAIVAKSHLPGSAFAQLDTLYFEILARVSDSDDLTFVRRFRLLMGSLILLRDTLPVSALERLLELPPKTAFTDLRTLNSLIMYPKEDTGDSGSVQFYHPSFPEFLLDRERSKKPGQAEDKEPALYIDTKTYETELALRCLVTIKKSRDIGRSSDSTISNELTYACTYWASHLAKSPAHHEILLERLNSFASHDFLWWLDIISIMKLTFQITKILRDAEAWAIQSNCAPELAELLNDFCRFAYAFTDTIELGIEQVGRSALPFIPRKSRLWEIYRHHCSINVLTGCMAQWSPLLSTLAGHGGTITSLAFSPDGSRLASGSTDATLRCWDAVSGRELVSLDGHHGIVHSLAFSPDGLRLASGSADTNVCLWDVVSGRELAMLQGHTDGVLTVAFSPDGSRLASGSEDTTIRLWDGLSGSELSTLKGHKGLIRTIAFSPDGSRLASASVDRTVHLWDGLSGRELATLEGHISFVHTLVFSPDGSRLASGSNDTSVRLWDGVSGRKVATLKGHSYPVLTLAFSPDGSRLASGSYDKTLRLWDGIHGGALATLEGHSKSVEILSFSPDGARLASGSNDANVRLWDGVSGKEIATLAGHSDGVGCLAFTPDGSRLASGSVDSTVRLWESVSQTEGPIAEGYRDSVCCLAFAPEGSRLVSASGHATAYLWDSVSGRRITALGEHSLGVTESSFSLDGSRLVLASSDATARLFETKSGKEVATLEGHSDQIRLLIFSPDGSRLLSASYDTTMRFWDSAMGKEIATLEGHSSEVLDPIFTPDGSRLVSTSDDGTVHMWDIKSGEEVATLRGHSGQVRSLTFSPDGSRLLSASDDTTMRLWDSVLGNEMAILEGHDYTGVTPIFSPNGLQLVSTSNNVVHIWDIKSGRELATLKGHTGPVNLLLFSSDGSRLLSASYDTTMRLWDSMSGEELAKLEGYSSELIDPIFMLDGSRLVSTSDDGTVHVWDTKSGREVATMKGTNERLRSLKLSPNGLRLAWASGGANVVHLLDTVSGVEIATLDGHEMAICCLAFSPDGARLASASPDKAHLWDAVSGRELATLKTHSASFADLDWGSQDQSMVPANDLPNPPQDTKVTKLNQAKNLKVEYEDGWLTAKEVSPLAKGSEGSPQMKAPRECRIHIPINTDWDTIVRAHGCIVAIGGTGGELLILDLSANFK